jgi:hypothetical protein
MRTIIAVFLVVTTIILGMVCMMQSRKSAGQQQQRSCEEKKRGTGEIRNPKQIHISGNRENRKAGTSWFCLRNSERARFPHGCTQR